ncbi:uncharacterized protein TNCV_3857241 [Trichonephila clavipes]|nr:uncharacterized protein TNCV_3857241 [Trichonephila clavipes]
MLMVLSKTPWIRCLIKGFQIISDGILARLSTTHLRCIDFEGGKGSFSICTKCSISPFSPQHILQCLGSSCEEVVAPPAVLRLSTDLWAHGFGLVKLDQMGISPTTTYANNK